MSCYKDNWFHKEKKYKSKNTIRLRSISIPKDFCLVYKEIDKLIRNKDREFIQFYFEPKKILQNKSTIYEQTLIYESMRSIPVKRNERK